MTRVCGHGKDDFIEYRRTHDAKMIEDATIADNGQTLYVKPRYICLFNTEDQKVDAAKVRDNHQAANIIFSGQNTDELAEVPNDTLHPFASLVGNPNVQLLPLDSSQVEVEYLQISASSLSGTQPLADAASRAGSTPGLLMVYIGVNNGNILGQAERPGAAIYLNKSTVGGYNINAELSAYNLGKTYSHELGHAFDLPHTFTDTCDGVRLHPDVPEQKTPNYDAELFQNGDQRSQRNCNRDKDRSVNQGLSCLTTSPASETSVNEDASNLMDYGPDAVANHFMQSQSVIIRNRLTNDNNDLTLFDAEGVAQTSVSSGLTTTQIILISVGAFLFVLIAALAVRYRSKSYERRLAEFYRPSFVVVNS